MRDLGVLMETNVTFNSYVDQQITRATIMLGFVKRNDKMFDDSFVNI